MENNPGMDEKVLARLRPHILAFAGGMTLWFYTIIMSLLIYFERGLILSKISGLPVLGGWLSHYSEPWGLLLLLSIVVVGPVLIYSIAKVSWRPLISSLFIASLIPFGLAYYGYGIEAIILVVIMLSLVMVGWIDLKRRRHLYIITNRRITTEYRGLFKSSKRNIVYSRLSDVITESNFLGKIFNFGNVYLISQASMGMGEDNASVIIGGGMSAGPLKGGVAVSGGKSVNVPLSRSQYILYAVPDPEKVSGLIVDLVKESEDAPYLKKIVEKLDNIEKENSKFT